MKTEKLYYSNEYIKEFYATVTSCVSDDGGYLISLNKTAFFPEGGGQKADVGFIGDARVSQVFENDRGIFHIADKPLNIGEEYHCKLDWEIRFSRMQNHSGEHIVSGVVHSIFGYDNVGFHMEDDYVTIDFSGELTREDFDKVETLSNIAVYDNIPVVCYLPDENELAGLDYRSKLDLKENVRLVKIGDVDLCACCAPHVKSTGEIGVIKILDFFRHRGGVRVTVKCGLCALLDYRNKYENIYGISNLLSAKQELTAQAVERVVGEKEKLSRDFSDFKKRVTENDCGNLEIINGIACFFSSFYDFDMMRELCNFAMNNTTLALIFSGSDSGGYSYIAGSNSLNMPLVAKALNSGLNGRGGGRETMIQGKVTAAKHQIVEFINNFSMEEF